MNYDIIIGRLKNYRTVYRKWRVLIWVLALTVGIGMGVKSFFNPKIFTAETIFHPESTGQATNVDLGNPVSFILGGGVGEGGEVGYMLGVLRSRNLSEAVMAEPLPEDSSKVLAELYLEARPEPPLITTWINRLIYGPQDSLTLRKKIIQAGKLIRNALEAETTEEGFIRLKISYLDAPLVQRISNTYIHKLRAYYREQKTEKAKSNISFFSHRADSVRRELDKVNRSLANYADRSRYKILAQDAVYPRELEAEQEILKQMYINLMLSREGAISKKLEDMPVVQVLDHPVPPFKIQKPAFIRSGIIFFLLTAILLFVWLSRKMLVKDTVDIVRYSLQPETEEKD
ncbi:MAG: hypothetical protein AAF206_12275 [Bacteroidota bacterium]